MLSIKSEARDSCSLQFLQFFPAAISRDLLSCSSSVGVDSNEKSHFVSPTFHMIVIERDAILISGIRIRRPLSSVIVSTSKRLPLRMT